ncbi:MAG: hypothetical protein K5664_07035 [Firmicutes bacterium]|nr:hypothetical protein [Bacillota bacterium]
MKQIGNLAVVAANNKECVLEIYNEMVTLYSGSGPERRGYLCKVFDDDSISKLISFVNFGTQIVPSEKIKCIR